MAEGLCELLSCVEVTKYEHQTPYSGSDQPASYKLQCEGLTTQTRHVNGGQKRRDLSQETLVATLEDWMRKNEETSSRWNLGTGIKSWKDGDPEHRQSTRFKKNVAGSVQDCW